MQITKFNLLSVFLEYYGVKNHLNISIKKCLIHDISITTNWLNRIIINSLNCVCVSQKCSVANFYRGGGAKVQVTHINVYKFSKL